MKDAGIAAAFSRSCALLLLFFFPSPEKGRPVIKHLAVFVIIICCYDEKMKALWILQQ